MNGAELGYWLGVVGASLVTFGTLGAIYWRLRVGYQETMERVKRENAAQADTDFTDATDEG